MRDFSQMVVEERRYSADHPGHVFLVMLRQDEAEELLDRTTRLDKLLANRFDPACECCRSAAQIASGNKSWPK